jgi:DNA-binding CsgD family transcriptional regulator
LLAECDRELASCGLRAPAGAGRDLLGLTAAELTVAHLVAQGLSNREVAARQYVSVKAVEYHLGHIYAKLGITSRRQLADSLTATTD